MKRWIPEVGETVTLKGSMGAPSWRGVVQSVSKRSCERGFVYLKIAGLGYTTASAEEIVIHQGGAQ